VKKPLFHREKSLTFYIFYQFSFSCSKTFHFSFIHRPFFFPLYNGKKRKLGLTSKEPLLTLAGNGDWKGYKWRTGGAFAHYPLSTPREVTF
jgi:hypothetical protein